MMDTRESPWGLQGRVQVGHARSHWGPGKDVSKLDTHDSPGAWQGRRVHDGHARSHWGLARTCPSWTRTTHLGHGKDDVSIMDTQGSARLLRRGRRFAYRKGKPALDSRKTVHLP